MPLLLDLLEASGELDDEPRYTPAVRDELVAMSAATTDRYLAPVRATEQLRGKSTTKAGPLAFAAPSRSARPAGEIEAEPGFFEVDTVAHCGPTLKGEFTRTVNMTDVLTGWTFTRSIRNNAEKHIIPLDLLKKEQDQLTSSILAIQRELDGYTADAALVEQHLTQALDLLEDCQRLYLAAPDRLKKLLNQVFFERILVNPAVDEDGCPIIPPPALQTSLKARRRRGAGGTKAGERMTATQGGEKTAESATSSCGEGAGGQSASSASQSGYGEAQPGPMHAVRCSTISIIDHASHTAVTGELASPFDQLGSQQLKRAAQQAAMGVASQQNATSDQATERREVDNPHGTAPGQTADCEAPITRTPVHDVDGRRRCNSGNDSTPTPVTQAKGSYTELVVDPAGLEPTTDAV